MDNGTGVPRRPAIHLFAISFLILFFELAAIRWFGGTVVFLSFFTNLILLASFVGMSVGLMTARRAQDFSHTSLPVTMLCLAAAIAVYLVYHKFSDAVTIAIGSQQASPELIYFGTEYRPADPSRWIVPIWAVAGTFFVLIALAFIGLGQVMGRAFDAIPDRLTAYSLDILGSLTGISAFALTSYFELQPTAWFLPVLLLMLYFAGWNRPVQIASAAAALALVAIGSHALNLQGSVFWSSYYKVAYTPATGMISTNGIGHQHMNPMSTQGAPYMLPHLLVRDAGGEPFADVLIVGAGSGNDVAAALRAGAQRVDAVEIDPRINEIGRYLHPDKPYSDPRVTVRIDDGRSFVRGTPRKYDLAVYALVDSLVLHSGYSSLRLENFLFTREAMEDVKRTLKPGGVFAMYNFYRQGWVVGRLAKLAEEVFGSKPMVMSLPYRDKIAAGDNQGGSFNIILVGESSARLEAVRRRFESGEVFWINPILAESEAINGFHSTQAPKGWYPVAPAQIDLRGVEPLPTDDWPQLYLRGREIPWAPIGQGMVTVALLSFLMLLAFAPARRIPLNGRMFFLGAGFMLIETKSVVHMALLFGSTWVVNSVVFFAILVMVGLANLYVFAARPRRLAPYYALLLAALLANALIPMNVFLALGPIARTVASCAVVFVPVFFAGVIFSSVFRESSQPDVDFGSNVAGIVLGGLSEQLSLVLGFSHLMLVAIAFYLLSLALRPRSA